MRCCGNVANCQTQSTTMEESASTPIGQMRRLLCMATWRSWAPWYTHLTSEPKKMSRRSGWISVCMYMGVCLCVRVYVHVHVHVSTLSVCFCMPHVLIIINHVIQTLILSTLLTGQFNSEFCLFIIVHPSICICNMNIVFSYQLHVILILPVCRSTPQTIWNGFLRWGWSIIITSLSLLPPWA